MNRVADAAIIIMTVLAFIFPTQLITAIRCEDEDKAGRAKVSACVLFGFIVLLLGMLANS